MKLTIEITDSDLCRLAPCQLNGEHDHSECVRAFVENQLLMSSYQTEAKANQDKFQQNYQRPSVSVTTE